VNAQRVLLRVFCSKRSGPHVIASIVRMRSECCFAISQQFVAI
jgi:hypothetical protein